MAKKRLWSVNRIQDPRYPSLTCRVGEYTPGGTLHVFRWIDGKQRSRSLRKTRSDLGTKPAEQVQRAKQLACTMIELWATEGERSSMPAPSAGPLTLKALARRYEDDGFAGRTAGYKRDALASIRRIAKHIGDVAVQDLTPSAVQKYMAERTKEGHAPAGRGDLVALSIACNWAIGEGLLKSNPLADTKARAKMKVSAKPARPVADKARYAALNAKAVALPPAFRVLLNLAWHTGHRISAILGLRWADVSFAKTEEAPNGSVTWYAGAAGDNKKHEHTLPLNRAASAALLAWRKETRAIGSAWVFPSATDATKALERHVTKKWLGRAETLAKLDHLKHGGWHMFRRGWATARKHFPLKDVAEAGGWGDTASVMKCYQHADQETTRKVVLTVA